MATSEARTRARLKTAIQKLQQESGLPLEGMREIVGSSAPPGT